MSKDVSCIQQSSKFSKIELNLFWTKFAFGLTEFSLVSGNITPGANTHNTSGNDGGMSSDCSDDEGSPGGPGGGNVQIYPWMKKIHVAGAGKEK